MQNYGSRKVALCASVGRDAPEHVGLKVAYWHSLAARREDLETDVLSLTLQRLYSDS